MFIRLSATWPETRAIAASRWSTRAWRRRMSGSTRTAASAISVSRTTTSSGSYCHSTTEPNSSGTRLPTTEKVIVSTKSSKREAKLSTRLVSEPAKLLWKNAESLAKSSSMPLMYSCSMPRASSRLRQWPPIRHSSSEKSSTPPKPRT